MQTERWAARPLTEVVREVATAIAESQVEIDRNAVELQRELREAFEVGEADGRVDVPRYRLSEVGVDLDVALSLRGRPEVDEDGEVRAYRPEVAAAPVGRDGDAERSSSISVTMVPVPPGAESSDGTDR